MKTDLYRHYHKKQLLYLGISNDATKRLKQHRKDKSWVKYVTKSKVVKYKTRDKALQMEEYFIKKEKPIFNTQHNKNKRVFTFFALYYLTKIERLLYIILIIYLGVLLWK